MANAVEVNQIPSPPLARFLFSDKRMAAVWLLVRLYVGYQWVMAGYEKIISPLWVGAHAGTALRGFLLGALSKTGGQHPDVATWYAAFLHTAIIPNVGWFSYIVAFGEFAVGIALILGIFTGIAAFFGAFMNMNYLFAGTVSINPLLFLGQLFLVLSWRVAGWWGIDHFLLPKVGVPWKTK